MSGAVVTGAWSGGWNGLGSCTTDINGQCSMTSAKIRKKILTETFTVTDVTKDGYVYDNAVNSVTVIKP